MRFHSTVLLFFTCLVAGMGLLSYGGIPLPVELEHKKSIWNQAEAQVTNRQINTIRLDFTPMASAISMYVLLHADGYARVVHYSRYLQDVVALYQGILSARTLESLFSATDDQAFREALKRENFAGVGLSQGDQVHLSLYVQGRIKGEIFGFLPDIPKDVQDFTQELLALTKQLDKISPAYAYMRNEPIEASRLEYLSKRKNIDFLLIHDFPYEIRSILTEAINNPYDFIVLEKAQYDSISTWRPGSHEFFVTSDHSGYQLHLFGSQSESEQTQ